jgi:hypothetical protein
VTTYRWVGCLAVVNRPSHDGRVIGVGSAAQIRASVLRRVPGRAPVPVTHLLQHRDLPLPLVDNDSDGEVGRFADVVGHIDTLVLDPLTGRLDASGTITVAEDVWWVPDVLARNPLAVGVDLDVVGDRSVVRRRLWWAPWRVREYRVVSEWRVMAATLMRDTVAPWPEARIIASALAVPDPDPIPED